MTDEEKEAYRKEVINECREALRSQCRRIYGNDFNDYPDDMVSWSVIVDLEALVNFRRKVRLESEARWDFIEKCSIEVKSWEDSKLAEVYPNKYK